MRATRKNLPALARAAGVNVTEVGSRTEFRKAGSVVVMYESGTIVRGDIDLSVAKAMTVGDVVEMFELDKAGKG